MKSTIGRKIGFAFLVVLILIAVMVVITFSGFNTITNRLHEIEQESNKRGVAGNLRFSITQLLMPSNDYIITEKDFYKREYNRWKLTVDDYLKQFIQLQLTENELLLVEKMKRDIDSIHTISAKIFSIPNPRQSPKAWSLMETMDYRFGEDVNMKTTQIFDGISRRIEEHRIQASADKESIANKIYIVTFFAIFVSFLVSYLTVQRISKPIITITKVANGIANGDYSQRPVVSTRDEIALLASSFSQMAEAIESSHRKLELSKQFTENIVDTVSSGLLAIGKNLEVLSINRSFCKLFNVTREQVVGKTVDSVLQTIGLSKKCRDAITERMPFRNLECSCSVPGKGELTLNLTLSGIYLAEEEEESLLVIDNITERKQAEEELLKIGTAIEQTADSVIITDRAGIIQYVNLAFTKITGYSKVEALGKTPRILKSGLHPKEFYQKLWKTILSGEVFTETFINKSKEGELIYEFKTISPIKDKEGNITHFVSTGKEITEQKRAEEEIIFQKNRFAQLFENSPVAIVLLNEEDRVVHINESFSALFGFYLEEIKGKILNDFIIPDEMKEEANLYSNLTREGSQINKESYRKKKDGTLVFVNIIGIPIIIDEKFVGIYGMYVDLTHRKEAEEKMRMAKELAEKSERLKSEFLAQMSHEIRSPLNAVLSFTNIIKEETADIKSKELEISFGAIDSASKRIIRTVDLILNMTDLQLGTYIVSKRLVDLTTLLKKLIKEYESTAKVKNLKLKYNCELGKTDIVTDDYAISQIFANLIDNAIKYTDEGFIEIRLLQENNKYIIEIEDSGIGISEEYLPELFSPFSQEEQGYSRKFEGTGLGMSLVKKYCELIDAEISVKSKKDVGTTFSVILKN